MDIKTVCCPLCDGNIVVDFDSRAFWDDPSIVYMDGWHHKTCLDDYMYGDLQSLEMPNNFRSED